MLEGGVVDCVLQHNLPSTRYQTLDTVTLKFFILELLCSGHFFATLQQEQQKNNNN